MLYLIHDTAHTRFDISSLQFPVGIAVNITTEGFKLEAMNDGAAGDVSFNWLAIGPP